MATREYMLGEHLPDFHVTLWVQPFFNIQLNRA